GTSPEKDRPKYFYSDSPSAPESIAILVLFGSDFTQDMVVPCRMPPKSRSFAAASPAREQATLHFHGTVVELVDEKNSIPLVSQKCLLSNTLQRLAVIAGADAAHLVLHVPRCLHAWVRSERAERAQSAIPNLSPPTVRINRGYFDPQILIAFCP